MSAVDKAPQKLSRRDFLRLSGGVICTGLSFYLFQTQGKNVRIRPPGALAESAFLSACQRCGRCTVACDRDAIQHSVDGTPYLNGITGWCDFCHLCVDVCPTHALQPFDPATTRLGTAVIDRDRCIAWDHIGCRLCYEQCENLQGAIYLDEDWRPHVDDTRCNGCGACVFVCPQSAVAGRDRKHGKAVAVIL